MNDNINQLLLQSGNDIPFKQAHVTIHVPTIKEIGLIGQDNFYLGCELLNFSKNNLKDKDKTYLSDTSNFEILMSVIKNKNEAVQKSKTAALLVLTLLFPDYKIKFLDDRIGLYQLENKEIQYSSINAYNFEIFKEILSKAFCLQKVGGKDYNPGGKLSKDIAEKIKKAKQRIAKIKGTKESQGISILSKQISILAVGQQKDKNSLLQLTIYQLFDEFNRYQRKVSYEIWLQAKMAGAQDLKDADNWMADTQED